MAAEENDDNSLPSTGLLLIGMGMGSIEGMTRAAIEAAKGADHRRYEAYTALWPEAELKRLEAEVGPIERVMRPEVEHPEALFSLAKESLVALLVVGDPLQATTHVDLQLRAEMAGLECHVYHGISITTVATGAVGLSNYRFGRQVTLTYPYGDWIATSPLELVAVNWSRNLHTLVLLDLDPTGQGTGEQRPMKPADAVHSMRLMWEKVDLRKDEPLSEEFLLLAQEQVIVNGYMMQAFDGLPVVLCSDMGTVDQRIVTTTLGALAEEPGGRMNCLIFPAGTSEVEEKALLRWKRSEE